MPLEFEEFLVPPLCLCAFVVRSSLMDLAAAMNKLGYTFVPATDQADAGPSRSALQ